MVKIITFEGSDYSGKTTTSKALAKMLGLRFNDSVIYPTKTSSQLLTIAKEADDKIREVLYTSAFILDKQIEEYINTNEIFIQDRYWPSIIAYGRFLNKENSIHFTTNFRELFIKPSAVIYLACSLDEKRKRSEKRKRKSILDKYLLQNNDNCNRLEEEIQKSLNGLENIIKIDTTNKNIKELEIQITRELKQRELI
ncbi:MAG: hypothetical protein ABIH25_04510 [Candidatus Woesearchaeota archaeon]